MPRETLSRDQIVRAAIELLDADGVDGLSMRRLGAHLGAGATSVYWHVKNKDDLVVLAGDAVFGEVELPDPEEVGWRRAFADSARALYAAFVRHPWLSGALSSHIVYGPHVARYDDHQIGCYQAAGFATRQGEWAISTVHTYVIGWAAGEAAEAAWRGRIRRQGGDEEHVVAEIEARVEESERDYPRLRERRERFAGEDDEWIKGESFEFGLAVILDGLEARLTAP